jgi:hypothetical protein
MILEHANTGTLMIDESARCTVEGCSAKAYAPGGTGRLCKDHFQKFVVWRRRRGQAMFEKYAAMTMEERDAVVGEWQKSLVIEK